MLANSSTLYINITETDTAGSACWLFFYIKSIVSFSIIRSFQRVAAIQQRFHSLTWVWGKFSVLCGGVQMVTWWTWDAGRYETRLNRPQEHFCDLLTVISAVSLSGERLVDRCWNASFWWGQYQTSATGGGGVSPNCPPLASLRSPCPTCRRGLQYHPTRHTPGVPPAALSPSQQSPLKNPKCWVNHRTWLFFFFDNWVKQNDSPCCVFGGSFLSRTSCSISLRRSSLLILHESKASLTNSDTGGLMETPSASFHDRDRGWTASL